jgi:hypothetical protein
MEKPPILGQGMLPYPVVCYSGRLAHLSGNFLNG